MCAQRRRVWDEKELARILAAHRYGLSTAEIATRFQCTATTIQKRLAELRAREELGMAP
jgi:DNA-directed RNA polymerase specialized sigma24 family protein